MPRPPPPVHHVLPADAIAQLQRAARTPITPEDPLARTKAIEQATRRIKHQYPQFFRPEKHYENQN